MTASSTWEVVGVNEVALGYVAKDDLLTSLPDATGTTVVVGAGQGVHYAAASTGVPLRIAVDTEAMDITARAGDNLTVSRGVGGTTGAAHTSGTANVRRIQDVLVPFGKTVTLTPKIQQITLSGDGAEDYVSLSLGLNGKIEADKWFTDVMNFIQGFTEDVANLPGDEVRSWAPDAGAYPIVRSRYYIHAIDDSTGLDVSLRIEIPKTKLFPRPWHPGNLQSSTLTPWMMDWVATKTKVDILGSAVPGTLTSRGVFYRLAELKTFIG